MHFASHRYHIISFVIDQGNKKKIQSTEYLMLKAGDWSRDGDKREGWIVMSQNVTIIYPGLAPDPPSQSLGAAGICISNKSPWELLYTLNFETTELWCIMLKCPSVFYLSIRNFTLHPISLKDLCITQGMWGFFILDSSFLMAEGKGK